jgi:NitT/TauT family transport system permease protein
MSGGSSPEIKSLAALEPVGSSAQGWLLNASRSILLPSGLFLAACAVWEFVCDFYGVRPVILPAPSRVVTTLFGAWDILFDNAIPTTLETLGGFALSVAFGSMLAIAMVYSRLAREVLYPNIVLFQLIPKIAVAPLFILWLGIEWQSRVAISLFIAFFPIVISTVAGLLSADPSLLRLCRSLGASEWQTFMRVRLPSALPFVFNGMKISMTLSIIGVIVGEFITSQQGLGYIILFAGSRLETALVMAALLMLCVVGLLLYGAVAALEWIVMRRYGA